MATFDEVAAVAVATQNHHMGRSPTSSIQEINVLFNRIAGKKRKKANIVSGGADIDTAVALTENQSIQNYYGGQTLVAPRSQPFQRAKMGWAQKAMLCTFHGREVRQNMSDERLFDYVGESLDNARDTAANRMAVEMHQDGAIAESIVGVSAFVQATGGGEYGTINSAVFTKWRNQVVTMAAIVTGQELETGIDKLYIGCASDGVSKPDLLVLPIDWFTLLEERIRDRTRYNAGYQKKDDAELGFTTMTYKNGMDVCWDINSQFGANATRGYMLCTSHIKYFEHPDANWKFDEGQRPINQDSLVMFAPWQGGVIANKRRCHGFLTKTP